MTSGAPGRSARRTVATPPSRRSSAPSMTSTSSSPRPTGARWRSPSTSRSRRHLTIPTSASTRSGSTTGPTARSQAPRTPKALRRHIPDRFPLPWTGGTLAGAARSRHVLDRPWGEDLPRRQPAHQAVRLLGMDHRRGEARSSRRNLPLGGLHVRRSCTGSQSSASTSRTRTSPGAMPSGI